MPQKPKGTAPKPKPSKPAEPVKPAPAAPKKSGTWWKVLLGILGGCLIIAIIAAIVGYFMLKKGVEKVGEGLENWEESLNEMNWNFDEDSWNEEWDEWLDDIEDTGDQEETKGELGDKLENKAVSLQVKSYEFESKLGDLEPYDGYQFAIVNVKYENVADDDISLYLTDVYLTDSRYNEYYATETDQDEVDDLIESIQNIPEGKSVIGNYVFEVEKGSKGLEFIFNDGINAKLVVEFGAGATAVNENTSANTNTSEKKDTNTNED